MSKSLFSISRIRSPFDRFAAFFLLLTLSCLCNSAFAQQQITSSSNNAIFLTHGWNASANAWPVQMGQGICNRLGAAVVSSNASANDFTLVCSGNNWDVWVIDWRSGAATGLFNPVLAFNNAFREGQAASQRIFPLNYRHLHLIAHSAGANLISSIAGHLRLAVAAQSGAESPFMHLSFLDAYHPNAIALNNDDRSYSTLGENADLIDNYIKPKILSIGQPTLKCRMQTPRGQ